MRKQEEPYLTGNLTAMIDVVFQLIIFFVCAISMQNTAIDDAVTLALAPNGAAETEKNPREFIINVHKNGDLYVGSQQWPASVLGSILKKTVADYGGNPDAVPVILRGDESVLHEKIQGALDACSEAGIVKIRFAALKEKGS
jgi:biopolymer transport protein ExbD